MTALFFALDGVRYDKVKISSLSASERSALTHQVPIQGEHIGLALNSAAVYMIPHTHNSKAATWLQTKDLPNDVFANIPHAESMGFCFLNPNLTNQRVKSQSGVFTIGVSPADKFPDSHAYKIIINKNFIAEIRSNLITMGIGAKSVYGDLQGLCQELTFTKFGGFSNRYNL